MPYLNTRKEGDTGIDSSVLYDKVSGSEYSMEQP